MTDTGGIETQGYVSSALFHVAVVTTLYAVAYLHLFPSPPAEEQPIVVEVVNLAPETRATQDNPKPAKTEKPDEKTVEAPPPPKKKPDVPKPPPPPQEARAEPAPAQTLPPPPDEKPQVAEVPPPPPPPPVPAPAPPPPQLQPQPQPQPQPQQQAMPEPPERKPTPPKKKVDDDMSFIKNLANKSPTRQQQEQPQKQAAYLEPTHSAQPRARLGEQLTTSERDAVIQQIEQCWNPPAGAKDAENLKPEFRVIMNEDGTVREAVQLNPERNSDPFFRAAAEAAGRALRNPRCQPLKLPPEKYDQWQTFTVTFDPKDL
jgi:hypothetical protein